MTIAERKQEIADMQSQLKEFIEKRDVESAKAKKEEIRQAKELLAIEEEEAEEAVRAAEQKIEERKENDEQMEQREINKELEYRALVKYMMGKNLTEEERAAVTTSNVNSNSGAIIPSEFINKVDLIRAGYVALKDYCDVIPVTSDNGKMPTTELNEELADLEEDVDLIESMIATKEVDYKVKDLGLLKSVANSTLEDSAVSFIDGILAPNFAVASINKENKMITSIIGSSSKSVTVAADAKVEDVLEKTILKEVPSIRQGLIVITNPEGYAHISSLKDVSGRKDDRVTEVNGKLYFKGKEVVEIDEARLPALSSTKTMVFYVVNAKFIKFFDRKQMEIAKSTEAGFKANKTLVRAIERVDIKANPYESVKPKKIEA